MFSERIFFIVERITDILNIDKERNIILALCKEEHSDDERKTFLELYSDGKKMEILGKYSVDEIMEILEKYSDDEIMEILVEYSDDDMEKYIEALNLRYDSEFLRLYLPEGKQQEFLKMYRELSDDGKQEFLYNYNDSLRNKIQTYLKFRQKHSAETFFEINKYLMGHGEGKEVVLSIDVKKRILKLHKELSRIHDYLRDVESKFHDRQVLSEYEQQFYLNLSYLADSCDDVLDRVMSYDVVAGDIDTLLQTIHNSYNISSTQFKFQVVVKDNTNIGGNQNIANMKLSINHSKSKDKLDSRPKSHSHVHNRHLVGFNREIQILLNHLIQPHVETRVVGIVGTGGAGKTTLAKQIYHHPEINTHFTSKLWFCISQSWDKTSILNQIWRQAAKDPMAQQMDYDQVVDRLYGFLSSHNYLVILDDIWSIDAWYDISPALLPCSGTKVVVTTRNRSLPQQIDPSVLIVEPERLNDEESSELFKREAFLPNESIPDHLLPLGMDMVKKCQGLPLAIIALAGALGIDKSKNSWERISKRLAENLLKIANGSTQGVVKEILALSYYQLPHCLKPCVLYLRIFPEDYEIEAQKLIQMWAAECFIDEESVGEEYLDEMARRCIVEVVETNYEGQVHRFRIHDLIRQMFVDMNQERGLLKDSLRLVPCTTTNLRLETNSHARSLVSLSHLIFGYELVKFRLLRVLTLRYINKTNLEEIGNLIHLRYLELGGSVQLPRSIVNLENLWTLDIRCLYCYWRCNENLWTLDTSYPLKELRHLYLPYSWNDWGEIAVRVRKLKTLWYAAGGEWMLLGMPKLSDTLQELSIRGINSKEQLEAVFRTPSITANTLHTLELDWNCCVSCELCDMSILGKCKSLKKLTLRGPIGVDTPIELPPNLMQLEMGGTDLDERKVMNIISKLCPQLKILSFESGSELVCDAFIY